MFIKVGSIPTMSLHFKMIISIFKLDIHLTLVVSMFSLFSKVIIMSKSDFRNKTSRF